MEGLAGDTDEEGGHLHELERRETPKESNRKEWHLEIYCQGTVEGLALFGKKAVIRAALQVCANMKMRARRSQEKGSTLFSMCTRLGKAIPDLISSN